MWATRELEGSGSLTEPGPGEDQRGEHGYKGGWVSYGTWSCTGVR